MRILVTNDDGITSNGIAELASAAVDTGLDVVVAAPIDERSGSSAALVVVESADGKQTERIDLAAAPGTPAYAVHASPALVVLMACRGSFGDPPDLVLSGINHGPNTGQAVLHSGTVGAAFTAVAHGVPAIAFSHVGTAPDTWVTAGIVARHVVRWAIDREALPALVLNVNSPDCSPETLRGLRAAHLAKFGAAQAQVETPWRKQTVTVSPDTDPPELDSDDALLAADYATVTPVMAPCESITRLPGLLGTELLAMTAEYGRR